jgi:hypothetical protein
VVILLMVNDCLDADLLAYRLLGLSLRRFKGRAGVILACSSRHVFGLNSCGRFDWWWLRFDVIKDFLDDIWISDVSDDTHSSPAQGA